MVSSACKKKVKKYREAAFSCLEEVNIKWGFLLPSLWNYGAGTHTSTFTSAVVCVRLRLTVEEVHRSVYSLSILITPVCLYTVKPFASALVTLIPRFALCCLEYGLRVTADLTPSLAPILMFNYYLIFLVPILLKMIPYSLVAGYKSLQWSKVLQYHFPHVIWDV